MARKILKVIAILGALFFGTWAATANMHPSSPPSQLLGFTDCEEVGGRPRGFAFVRAWPLDSLELAEFETTVEHEMLHVRQIDRGDFESCREFHNMPRKRLADVEAEAFCADVRVAVAKGEDYDDAMSFYSRWLATAPGYADLRLTPAQARTLMSKYC